MQKEDNIEKYTEAYDPSEHKIEDDVNLYDLKSLLKAFNDTDRLSNGFIDVSSVE